MESIKRHDNGITISDDANSSAEVPDLLAWVLDYMDDEELHDAFKCIFQGDAPVLDRELLKGQVLFGLQNLSEIYNVPGSAECRSQSSENEDRDTLIVDGGSEVEGPGGEASGVGRVRLQHSVPSSTIVENTVISNDRQTLMAHRGCEGGGHLGERSPSDISDVQSIRSQLISNDRSSSPAPRYIEEMSVKSGSEGKRLKRPVIISRDKFVHDRLGRQHLPKVDPAPVYQKGHIRRAHPTAHSESVSVDDAVYGATGQTNNKKVRRKHHRQWTPSEVENLIDGVSLYGFGQWSKIKGELFPTSTFRTSVDLKDKWRNLVNASMVHLGNKHKGGIYNFPVPKSELERVREISIIHPHPRMQK